MHGRFLAQLGVTSEAKVHGRGLGQMTFCRFVEVLVPWYLASRCARCVKVTSYFTCSTHTLSDEPQVPAFEREEPAPLMSLGELPRAVIDPHVEAAADVLPRAVP